MTSELSAGDKRFTAWGYYGVWAGAGVYVQMGSRESREKSPVARAPHERSAGHLSIRCSISGALPPICAANAPTRDRLLLERPSNSRRSPHARACSLKRSTEWLELAAREWTERITSVLSNATCAVSRTSIRQGFWILPCVRSTCLSFRLARGSLE
jgi:hypothetical protein